MEKGKKKRIISTYCCDLPLKIGKELKFVFLFVFTLAAGDCRLEAGHTLSSKINFRNTIFFIYPTFLSNKYDAYTENLLLHYFDGST